MRVPFLHLSTGSGSLSPMKLLLPLLMVQLWGEPWAEGDRREGPGPEVQGMLPLQPQSARLPGGPDTHRDIPSRSHPRVGSVPRCRAQLLENPAPAHHQLRHLSASPTLPLLPSPHPLQTHYTPPSS